MKYTIEFELKSKDISKNNQIKIYLQNGNGSAHYFTERYLTVTTEFKKFKIDVTPGLLSSDKVSYLSFFGSYGTGNSPVVKNLKISLASNKETGYEKYTENDLVIKLDEPLYENNFIKEENGEIKLFKKMSKYTLTGNEQLYNEESLNPSCVKFVIQTTVNDIKSAGNVICNKLKMGNDTIADSIRLGTSNKVVVNIDKKHLSTQDQEGFKK